MTVRSHRIFALNPGRRENLAIIPPPLPQRPIRVLPKWKWALAAAWLVAVLAAWGSAGLTPLRDALAGAVAPGDFATDFVAADRLWRGQAGIADVHAGNAAGASWGAPPYAAIGVPYGAHPPPAVMLVAALVPFGFRGAAIAWLAISLGALAVVAWVIGESVAASRRRRAIIAAAIFVGLVLWPPSLHNIEKGQWSLVIAGLLAGAWWAYQRGHHKTAGAIIAVAGCLKVMPLVVVLALARRDHRRAVLGGAVAALGLAFGATVFAMGLGVWRDFIASAPLNTAGWQTGPANTLSLWGALARLLVGGPFARPWSDAPHAPTVAVVVWIVGAGALVLALLRGVRSTTRAAMAPRQTAGFSATFAGASALAVLLGPLSWSHTATWLALPVALLATSTLHLGSRGTGTGQGLAGSIARVARPGGVTLAVSFAVLCLPRATLFAWAGPLPVSPGGGLILGAHAAAVLAIFFVAAAGWQADTGAAWDSGSRDASAGANNAPSVNF